MVNNNNRIFFLCLIASLVLVTFSCKKKKKEDPVPTNDTEKFTDFKKKWSITSTQKINLSSTVPQISTIEFIGNYYIVIFSNDSTIVNTYSEGSSNLINLNYMGSVTIKELGENYFDFDIQYDNNDIHSCKSVEATAIEPTAASLMICSNRWRLTNVVSTDPLYTFNADDTLTAYFSKYKTYLEVIKQNVVNEYDRYDWNWTDGNQTSICLQSTPISSCSLFNVSYMENNNKLILVNTDLYTYTYTFVKE